MAGPKAGHYRQRGGVVPVVADPETPVPAEAPGIVVVPVEVPGVVAVVPTPVDVEVPVEPVVPVVPVSVPTVVSVGEDVVGDGMVVVLVELLVEPRRPPGWLAVVGAVGDCAVVPVWAVVPPVVLPAT